MRLRTLTKSNHREAPITLEELKERKKLYEEAVQRFNKLTLQQQLSSDSDLLRSRINRLVRQLRIARGSFFGGNN